MEFTDYIKSEKKLTDTQLLIHLDRLVEESEAIDENYATFALAIKNLALRGGKRLRPLLVRLSYELLSSSQPEFNLVEISIYTELLHLFMLVHDDIADKDMKRYGGPSLEQEFASEFKSTFGYENLHFGTSLALIAGDLIHVLANGVMIDAQIEEAKRTEVMRHMQHVLHQVIAGWHIHFWQNHQPLSQASQERYLKGMQLVSASYSVQGPLLLGAILADKQDQYGERLNQLGYHIGMAFQMQDDILGVFGDTHTTGKPAGNDIREGKKTLLVLKAYELSNDEAKQLLEKVVGKSDMNSDELDKIKSLIESSGALRSAKSLAEEHVEKAFEILDQLEGVNPEPKQTLQQLAEFMVKRSY